MVNLFVTIGFFVRENIVINIVISGWINIFWVDRCGAVGILFVFSLNFSRGALTGG